MLQRDPGGKVRTLSLHASIAPVYIHREWFRALSAYFLPIGVSLSQLLLGIDIGYESQVLQMQHLWWRNVGRRGEKNIASKSFFSSLFATLKSYLHQL